MAGRLAVSMIHPQAGRSGINYAVWSGILALILAITLRGPGGPEALESWPEECVVGPDGEIPKAPDHIAIANDILAETSDAPLFDKATRDDLATEIDGVLRLVRSALPPHTDVRPPIYFIPQLTLGLQGSAADRAREMVARAPEWPAIVERTGDRDIDLLSDKLGLRAVELNAHRGSELASARLCLSDLVNPTPAARLFENLDNVEYAEGEAWMSIDWLPGINMRKYGDSWYVVTVAKDQGCTFGCGAVRSFFKVTEGVLRELPPEEAAWDARFRHVERLAEWGMSH